MKVIRLVAATLVTAAFLFGADDSLAACDSKNLGIYGATEDPLVWVLLSESYDPALEHIQYDPAEFEMVRAAGTGGGGGPIDPNGVDDQNARLDGPVGPATSGAASIRSTPCLPPIVVTATPPRGGSRMPVLRPMYWFGAGSGLIRWLRRSGRTVYLPPELDCGDDTATIVALACHALANSGLNWWSSMERGSTFDVMLSDGWMELEFKRRKPHTQCAEPIGGCRAFD